MRSSGILLIMTNTLKLGRAKREKMKEHPPSVYHLHIRSSKCPLVKTIPINNYKIQETYIVFDS